MISRIAIRTSLSIYRALLLLYPSGFRNQYGALMLQTFAESFEAEHHSRRRFCKALSVVIRELPRTVLVQHAIEFRQRSGQSARGFWLGLAVAAAMIVLILRCDALRLQESLGIGLAVLVAVYFTIATSASGWKGLIPGVISGSLTAVVCVLIDAMTNPPVNLAYYGLVLFVLCFSIALLALSFVMRVIIEGIASPNQLKLDCSPMTGSGSV